MGRGAANAFDGSDGKGFMTYCGTSWRDWEVESRPSLAEDCSSKDESEEDGGCGAASGVPGRGQCCLERVVGNR